VKLIKIEVKSCQYCLYHNAFEKDEEDIEYCELEAEKQIDDSSQIPNWCPLDDLEKPLETPPDKGGIDES